MSGLFGDCPTWLDEEAWGAYVEWRQSLPKKQRMTPYAQKLILTELNKLREAGEDPTACLQQSMRNSWLDVYAVRKPKPAPFTAIPANDSRPVVDAAAQTAQYLASREMSPEEIKAAAARAKEKIAAMKRRAA